MKQLKLQFVSDIACPWCAVGLASLLQALARCGDALCAVLTFEPFELNPNMPPQGEDTSAYLLRKYGATAQSQAQTQRLLQERGAAVGVQFAPQGRSRIVNTFDAHRLLWWAGQHSPAQQLALKQALLRAYHELDQRVDQASVLLDVVGELGLDAAQAGQILAGDEFAAEVRAAEQRWQHAGVQSVPTLIIDGQHAISGGQPPEVFEQALRQLAGANSPAAGL